MRKRASLLIKTIQLRRGSRRFYIMHIELQSTHRGGTNFRESTAPGSFSCTTTQGEVAAQSHR